MLDQFRGAAPEVGSFVASAIDAPIGRWAVCVRAVVVASEDIPSVGAWADIVNMARSTLCGRCRAVDASVRDSLAFGRLARALTLDDRLHWRPENVINVVNPRTMRSLLQKGGLLSFRNGERPPPVVLFDSHRFRLPAAGVTVLAAMLGVGRRAWRPGNAKLPRPHRSGRTSG